MRIPTLMLSLAALSFACTACDMDHHPDNEALEHHHESMWANIHEAVAVIQPTKGNSISGTIYFTHVDQMSAVTKENYQGSVHIHGTITGLEPNSVHAMHIHEFGDATSADGMSTGSHYDPEGTHHHGGPATTEPHHPGDFGNITADASGKATIDLTLTGLSIAGMKDPIIGRALVIHAKPDDFSQPVGNAGGRIGVAIIGIAKPQP